MSISLKITTIACIAIYRLLETAIRNALGFIAQPLSNSAHAIFLAEGILFYCVYRILLLAIEGKRRAPKRHPLRVFPDWVHFFVVAWFLGGGKNYYY